MFSIFRRKKLSADDVFELAFKIIGDEFPDYDKAIASIQRKLSETGQNSSIVVKQKSRRFVMIILCDDQQVVIKGNFPHGKAETLKLQRVGSDAKTETE